ncbi:MAG: hypothetical protein HC767_13815 [Akkermansiaceae bacterium]|nr:hypothetical protein [Akkermansiaceae bacterium]
MLFIAQLVRNGELSTVALHTLPRSMVGHILLLWRISRLPVALGLLPQQLVHALGHGLQQS